MSSAKQLKVLTAVGRDRPGLVKGISAAIHSAGANIEDSRMAVLGGEFAMIVLCSGDAEQLARAEVETGRAAEELELEVHFRGTALSGPRSGTLTYELRVSGLDHPGIVEAVTAVLVARGVNVASLSSHILHQPLSGTPAFVLEAELHVPSSVALSELRKELGRMSEQENLDFVLEARI